MDTSAWSPGEETEAVEADQDCSPFMSQNTEWQRNLPTIGEDWKEEGGQDHRYDGASGEEQVLPDDALGCRCDAENVANLVEVVGHQHDIRAFHGDVATGCAHGDTERRGGEGRGIVGAVADHGNFLVLSQFAKAADFVFGQ